KKTKKSPARPLLAFDELSRIMVADMFASAAITSPPAKLLQADARDCRGVPDGFATLVVTSPPYPNNYDYADATRLEMCFLQEINGWGDLQGTVRQRLVRSCSQHVPESAVNLEAVLAAPELEAIRPAIIAVCRKLGEMLQEKGG